MRRTAPHAAILVLILSAAGLATTPAAAAPTFTDPTFQWADATPGFTWELPTNIVFLPGGRMLVTEKTGRVWSVVNGVKSAQPMLDLSTEVLNQHDRGLLGIAVDPNYVANHHLYLLYTVDPDSNNVDTNDDAYSRLSRFTVSFADSNVIPYSSRVVLFGHNWRNGPVSASPSHTIGDLQFGSDGTLIISIGDGAQFSGYDAGGVDAGAFGAAKTDPYEDIGAFRAQYIGSLAGKMLRIDPATGQGLPSNPFYQAASPGSVQSRVWAYGVRNPFRFKVRPGTGSANPADGNPGTLYIGEVGYNAYEELNVAPSGGLNFGWPCYEGANPQTNFQAANPAHHGCGTIGTSINPSPHTPPLTHWHHSAGSSSSPTGIVGNCATGGAFYTGGSFPATYPGKFFYMDYGKNWMRLATVNGANQLTATEPFATGLEGPVDLEVDPNNGHLVYVSITSQQIRRIYHNGVIGNTPPVASAAGTPTIGAAPLPVTFSSSGSFDPNGDPITFGWVFGDGQGATTANAQHTYAAPGSYTAVLTVTDAEGAVGRDTVYVIATPGTFPTTGVLDDFNRPNGAIGGGWVDNTNGLSISNSRLVQTCCTPSTVWSTQTFGPDQEAHIRFLAVTPDADEQDLMLKVQGLSYSTGHIEVRYDAKLSLVRIATYTPATSWIQVAAFPAVFAPGDQLGARTYADGTIQAFKNGVLLGETSTGDWPFTSSGGRLGMTFDGATSSQLDDFGGGNVVFNSNTPPSAQITSPADNSFFEAHTPVPFTASATDGQQAANTLSYVWTVDMHHNNHVHPGAYVATGADTLYEPEDHDDGTGVWAEVRLVVTDSGGLADTATVAIFPNIDLAPTLTSLSPDPPVTGAPMAATFRIHNLGHMNAHLSKWRLLMGNTTIAEADTTIPAHDSLLVKHWFAAGELPAGPLQFRLVADTMASITEPDESNNALTVSRVVEDAGATGVGDALLKFALGEARPNPSTGPVAFALELPRGATVGLEVFDTQGRLVHAAPERTFAAGRFDLRWDGTLDGRRRAPVGLYWARVRVNGATYARRVAVLR